MIGLEYILRVCNIQQKDLAEELGINKQNITLWLKGKQNIPKKYLSRLSEKFNFPTEYFQKEITEFDGYEIQQYREIGTVEELKAFKSDDFTQDLLNMGYTKGYIKAIDKFAEALRLKCLDSVYKEVGMYSILQIAEQMKAGGMNE